MLTAKGISKRFDTPGGSLTALHPIDVSLEPQTRQGLVGPSGCGKSTLARILALLMPPDTGSLWVGDQPITGHGLKVPPVLRRSVQLLWQSPRAAADPRMRLAALIREPADLASIEIDLARWTELTGLTNELLERFPHEVSEGQLQRALLARALACEPQFLICDEPTSMLDVSSQAALLKGIEKAQEQTGLGVLLISHDGALVDYWCGNNVIRMENPAQ
ncbi:MAG: ABC transporter ATP-binding protein [Actinomycetota bacterium]